MSRTGPDAALDLVAIALETLRADLLPSLPPEKRYTALMIANALSVAQRELREGEAARRTMLEALQGLLGGHPPGKEADLDAAVQCLLRKLATAIEQGEFDAPGHRLGGLMVCLNAVVSAKLLLSRGRR